MSDITLGQIVVAIGIITTILTFISKVVKPIVDVGKKIDEIGKDVKSLKKDNKMLTDITYVTLSHMATNNQTGQMREVLDKYNAYFRED